MYIAVKIPDIAFFLNYIAINGLLFHVYIVPAMCLFELA